jgi:hypothetical protein
MSIRRSGSCLRSKRWLTTKTHQCEVWRYDWRAIFHSYSIWWNYFYLSTNLFIWLFSIGFFFSFRSFCRILGIGTSKNTRRDFYSLHSKLRSGRKKRKVICRASISIQCRKSKQCAWFRSRTWWTASFPRAATMARFTTWISRITIRLD